MSVCRAGCGRPTGISPGFWFPVDAPVEQRGDADVDEESEVAETAGLGDDSAEDRRAAKKGFFPSSMGLSFLVGANLDTLEVIVRWGDYRRVEAEGGSSGGEAGEAETGGVQRGEGASQGSNESGGEDGADGRMPADQAEGGTSSVRSWWQRTPREVTVPVTLPAVAGSPRPEPVRNSGGLTLHAVARPVDAAHFAGRIPPGTRSVSVFLVNGRRPSSDRERDEAFAFQAEIEVRSSVPLVPRPDPREVSGNDWDERVADLHYANTHPSTRPATAYPRTGTLVEGACRSLRTAWTPAADVEKTETFDVPGAELDMRVLGALADGSAAEGALTPLVTEYRSWVEQPAERARAGWPAIAWRRPKSSCSLRRSPRTGWSAGSASSWMTRARSTPSAPRIVPWPPLSRAASTATASPGRRPTGGRFSSPSSS